MALTDYLPVEESKLLPWLSNYVSKLTGHRTTLGLTQDDVDGARLDADTLTHLIKGVDTARTSGVAPETLKEAVAYKDLMKWGPSEGLLKAFPSVFSPLAWSVAPGILPRLLAFLKKHSTSPKCTPALIEKLGINIPDGGVITDAVPKGDNLLAGWMRSFVDRLGEHRAETDVTDKEYAGLRADSDVLTHLVRSVDGAINDGKGTPLVGELIKYKDWMIHGADEKMVKGLPNLMTPLAWAVAPGILPRFKGLCDRIRGNRAYTDTLGRDIGCLPAAIAEPVKRVAPVAAPVVAAERKGAAWWPWLLIPLLALGAWGLFGKKPAATPMARGEADLLLLHGATAKEWLTDATVEFNKTPGGRILLDDMGTREARDNILYDKQKIEPDMWAPGDDYWIGKLQEDAKKNLPGASGATVSDGTPIIRTYLCFIMRDEKAKVFEEAMKKPQYDGKTWALVADLATKGWTGVGGAADWGKLSIAQSSPLKSNSAMLALTLMYNEFKRANPAATVNSPGFVDFMKRVESGVASFAPTTKEAMDSLINDMTKDMLIGYEAEALQMLQNPSTNAGYRIVYPVPTIVTNIPAATVQAKWVDDTDSQRASEFVNYLLTTPLQKKALDTGYRPVSEGARPDIEAFFGTEERKAVGMLVAPETRGGESDSGTKSGLIFKWSEVHPGEK